MPMVQVRIFSIVMGPGRAQARAYLEGPSPVLKEGPKPARGPRFSAASVSAIFGIVQFW